MKRKLFRRATLPVLLAAICLIEAGCATVRITDSPRTATEQFLISEAISRSIKKLSTKPFKHHRIYINTSFLKSVDQEFLVGELRAQLVQSGAHLVQSEDEAQLVLEPRSVGVGIDRYEFLIGVPGIPFPWLSAGSGRVTTPKLPLIRLLRQEGIAGVGFVSYGATSRQRYINSGPFIGRIKRWDSWFLGIGPLSGGEVSTVKE